MDVKDFYNKYQYPNLNFFKKKQEKRYNKLIKNILKTANLELKDLEGKRILDAGCGTGEKSIVFSKNKAEVVGIDFSKNQIEKAKKLRENEKQQKIEFYVKDFEKDNLKDLKEFDIIFVMGSLPVIKNSYQAFKNLLTVLKKDGVIILGLYHRYARVRYRINRFFLHLYSKDFKKLEKLLFKSKLTKNLRKAPNNTLYDRYLVPYENYHSLKQIKKWFKKNNLELISYSKNVEGIELFKVFNKKTFFIVSSRLKKR